MSLQSVIFLSTLTTLVAGNCNVYDSPQSSTTDNCRQIQECVEKAFVSNKNNMYILDKVFKSTQTRSPIALIVKYKVTTHITDEMENIISGQDQSNNSNSSDSGSGSGNHADGIYVDRSAEYNRSSTWNSEENAKSTREVTYVVDIGWSTTVVYKFIRPAVLVALQPVTFWQLLTIAIDDYGFPKSIELKLNITNTTECQRLENVASSKVREALEHLTTKVNDIAKIFTCCMKITSMHFSPSSTSA